jgi:hypothetical protein
VDLPQENGPEHRLEHLGYTQGHDLLITSELTMLYSIALQY